MATKKYLYKKCDGSECTTLVTMANRYMPSGAQITSAIAAGAIECCQISIDETGKDDLDELMPQHGYAYLCEVTGNDVKPTGTKANIPSALEVPDGFEYFATDELKIYKAYNDAWHYTAALTEDT